MTSSKSIPCLNCRIEHGDGAVLGSRHLQVVEKRHEEVQMQGARSAAPETYHLDRRGCEHRATPQMGSAIVFQQPACGVALQAPFGSFGKQLQLLHHLCEFCRLQRLRAVG